MKSAISHNLKKYRKLNKLTQQEMAKCLFVTPQAVSKWELGSSMPDITLIPMIADLFQVSISDLWYEEKISLNVLDFSPEYLITDQQLEELLKRIKETKNIHEILANFEFFYLLNNQQKEQIIFAILNRPEAELLVEDFFHYLSPYQKEQVILILLEKNQFLALEGLVPMLNKNLRTKVLEMALDKKNWDFLDELFPFLNVTQKDLIVSQIQDKKLCIDNIENYLTFFTPKQRQELALYEEENREY